VKLGPHRFGPQLGQPARRPCWVTIVTNIM
jgi:hypothetical protein